MHAVYCKVLMCISNYLLWDMSLLPWAFRGLPYCILFVLVKLQAASSHFTYRLRIQASADSQQEQHGSHKPVCLAPGFVDKYLHAPFKRASNHILWAFNSEGVGINTASCQGPTCFVPELVAGNGSVSLTQVQPQTSL